MQFKSELNEFSHVPSGKAFNIYNFCLYKYLTTRFCYQCCGGQWGAETLPGIGMSFQLRLFRLYSIATFTDTGIILILFTN